MSDRGDYRSTYCTFWDDADVHQLSHLAYRVLTTLKGTLSASGIGIVYLSQLAERCNADSASVVVALAELEQPKSGESYGWIVRERNIVWIVNGLRYEPTLTASNRNHRTFLRDRLIAPLGDKPTVVAAFRRYYAEWFEDTPPMPFDRVSEHNPSQSIPSHPLIADEAREGEPELTALYLTICANTAVAEKWGEQPNPYIQAGAINLAEALAAQGVEPAIARLSIYRQCRESQQPRHPRSVNYFRRGIEEDWQHELARRAVATSGETPPPAVEKKEHWRDKVERKVADEKANADWKHLTALVETRRARTTDGSVWWARMQRESGATGKELYRYAANHLAEDGHLGESAA